MSTTRPDWHRQIDPELRGIYRKLPKLTFSAWKVRAFRWLEAKAPSGPIPEGVAVTEVALGGVRLRISCPAADTPPTGALLWLHGGGRMMGRPEIFDGHAARLVRELGLLVVAPTYRVAPEHPFPAALDDVTAAWHWLVEHAAGFGVPEGHFAVGGESAGGGLAAELCQRLLDEGGPQPRAQALVYPMLDDRTALRDDLTAMAHPVWNNTSNALAWRSYLGEHADAAEVPAYAAASRREDLSGLPPAWVTAGDMDLFLEEDRAYVERLQAAGVPAVFELVPGGFHGFFVFGQDEAPFLRVWNGMKAFLQAHLTPAASAVQDLEAAPTV